MFLLTGEILERVLKDVNNWNRAPLREI